MRTIFEAINELRTDKVSGGYQLGMKAYNILKDIFDLYTKGLSTAELGEYLEMLKLSRPTFGIVYNVADIPKRALHSQDYSQEVFSGVIDRLGDVLSQAKRRIRDNCNKVSVPDEFVAVTLSYSSNVAQFLEVHRDRILKVCLLESRPGMEVKYAFEKALSLGLDVEVLPDSNIYHALRKNSLIVIGVDNIILGDGVFIHKAGTYPLILSGESAEVLKIMVGEGLKITDTRVKNINLERWSYTIHALDEQVEAYPFDFTPIKYIDIFVSDVGIIRRPNTLTLTNLYINQYLRIIG
jgi:translation initiation factor 2B subunit (eIF-2B alpha/beta/delta family)